MALTDDIQKLEELHQRGTLSKEEFEKAKAVVLAGASPQPSNPTSSPAQVHSPKKGGFFDLRANLRALVRILLIIAVFVAIIWALVYWAAGPKAASRVVSSVARTPITLRDATENIPANSWKALALDLPYSGTVSVSIDVVHGNPVDVFVLDEANLEKLKVKDSFLQVLAFEATKTKTYRRSERLPSGTRFLVIMDKTLGVLSASATDVKVTARLSP